MSFIIRIFVSKKNIMIRIKSAQNRAKINIYETYNMILDDLFKNQKDIVLRYKYYTTKYRGDLLNDVNIGIFEDAALNTVAQIYLSNGDTKLKSTCYLDDRQQKIIDLKTKLYTMIIEFELPMFEDKVSYDERLNERIKSFLDKNPHLSVAKNNTGQEIKEKRYPKNNNITTSVVFI